MNKMFGFVLGAMVGGLLGATIALLLTPTSGEALRGQIRQRGASFTGEVQEAARQRREQLESRLAELRAPRKPALPPEA